MDDDRLLADLRAALHGDRARAGDDLPHEAEEDLPPGLVEALQDAHAWRRVDEELAELLADEPVGVRGSGGAAVLAFDSGAVAVDVQVLPDGPALRVLVGLVDPPRVGRVRVERPGALPVEATVDADGRFRVAGVPAGPVRVVVSPANGGADVATDWITA